MGSSYWNNKQNNEVPFPYSALPDDNPPTKSRRFLKVTLVLSSLFLAAVVLVGLIHYTENGNGKAPRPAFTPGSDAANSMPSSETAAVGQPRGVAEGVSPKSIGSHLGSTVSFSWSRKTLAWQRSAFHFQPKKNWMNGEFFLLLLFFFFNS